MEDPIGEIQKKDSELSRLIHFLEPHLQIHSRVKCHSKLPLQAPSKPFQEGAKELQLGWLAQVAYNSTVTTLTMQGLFTVFPFLQLHLSTCDLAINLHPIEPYFES